MRLILAGFFSMILSFSSAQDYFEGTVSYEYEYTSLYKFISTDYIKKNFPTRSILHYKGSKYVEELFYNGDKPSTKTLYDLEMQKAYVIDPALDTVWQYSIDVIPGKLLKSEKTSLKKEVLGKNLPSYHLEYIVDMYNGKKTTAVYYYDTELTLNQTLYSDYKQSYWNLYTENTQSIYLASSMSIEKLYRLDATATKIDKKELPTSFFELPADKVVAEKK